MLDPKSLDDLTRRLAVSLPKGLQTMREDLHKGLRASLEAGLTQLDLVSREEFDVQSAVLARTRERLRDLETRVRTLEQKLAERTADAADPD